MTGYALHWAVFCAVLVPVMLRSPSAPVWVLVLHIGLGFALLALADRLERRS